MKYKILGFTCCFAVILIAIFAPLLYKDYRKTERIHQHEQEIPQEPCTDPADGGLCTYLPIVKIDTDGVVIPGRPIKDDGTNRIYTRAADGEATIAAQMDIIGNDSKEYHHANETADVSSAIRIRMRGNSSRKFDKPSYAIRLVDKKEENNPLSIMGMDAHHEWALYGPWLDKTAIRNYMFYNLAGEMMSYAPNVRFCEVILNGEYEGLYVMTEMITGGKDGTRLGLRVNAKRSTFSGYLLRLDHQHEGEEALNSFTTYTYKTPFLLQIEYPGNRNRDARLTEEIRQDFSNFEKTLYSYDYDREKHGYTSMIDVDSFVDYFIINELSSNADAGNYSTYIYKGTDNLYRMCVWDFNNACNNYFEEELPYTGFFLNNRLWFEMLIKDEDFTERIIQRYHSLRKGLLSEEALYRYIDETLDFIAPALKRNDARWGSVEQQAKGLLVPVSRNLDSRSAAEGQLKGYLRNRGKWLDENIETLRQYSASSRVKQYNEVND